MYLYLFIEKLNNSRTSLVIKFSSVSASINYVKSELEQRPGEIAKILKVNTDIINKFRAVEMASTIKNITIVLSSPFVAYDIILKKK